MAGFFDLGHFCQDKDPIRLVGAAATRREDKDVFRFEVAGHGTNHRLFADSREERATWISYAFISVLPVIAVVSS